MSDDLFVVLGIAPTTDLDAVKRGYFQALKAHPPHADPEGFRRLRRAYETLSKPSALRAAWLAAGATPGRDLEALEALWGGPLGAARLEVTRALHGEHTRARFAHWVSARSWEEISGG